MNFLRSHFCMFSIALRAAKCGRQRLQSPEMETRSGHGRGGDQVEDLTDEEVGEEDLEHAKLEEDDFAQETKAKEKNPLVLDEMNVNMVEILPLEFLTS
ncbi:hypothetical protein L3X38_018413 [Prunus dulcis]|uniref:Uncharacterized protein n=1 Tax=Prunus dulcis TaxID=3755 RepID=A0AAD4ZAZ6_PRUDU|nr:hypothetical protein L3X38_018413 [Prunus dulcis]